MSNFAAIVLAAGKGTRMKSILPKVLHPVTGLPMLEYPLRLLKEIRAKKVIVVVGHGAGTVKEAFSSRGAVFVEQKNQLGTGHAVLCGMKGLGAFKGDVLILSGDTPLVTKDTITSLLNIHKKSRAAVSLVTAVLDDAKGYGRVIRDNNGDVVRITEDRDCGAKERSIREINAGIYLVSSGFLAWNIKNLDRKNSQKEYYLPDLVRLACEKGEGVGVFRHPDATEVMGVNNRVDLARANGIMRVRILNRLMLDGVTIVDPENTYIDPDVKIGMDTTVCPGAHILGKTVIGKECVIGEGVRIKDSIIGDNAEIRSYSVIESTSAGRNVIIGPFARLRPGNVLDEGVHIGNFVEVKKTAIGKGTKANHLTYLGDSVIGKDVNIGAGTITCNYDGAKKHSTIIEDGAFIGSDTQLVAPVKVGRKAYVGSGTTVTRDVKPGSLVMTRAMEKVIDGWAGKRKKKARQG